MRYRWVFAFVSAMTCACAVRVDAVDDAARDVTVACGADGVCPGGMTCQHELGVCLLPGAQPPRQAVTFVVPQDGETNVSTTSALLVAFSLPADVDSAQGLLRLRSAAGDDVPLAVAESPVSTTLVVTHEELAPLTTYTFGVAPGVRAREGSLALPTAADASVTFVTGERRDDVPPASVSHALVDRVSLARADLSWTNPLDADLSGVLVVRRAGAPLDVDPLSATNDLPEDGVAYSVGARLGASRQAEVAAVVRGDRASVVDLGASSYDFAFFAFDVSANYSAPTRAPFVAEQVLSWCPNELGTFSVDSPDAAQQRLLLTPQGGGAALVLGPAAAGEATAFSAPADVTSGVAYSSRCSLSEGDNQTLAAPEPFVASAAALTPVVQPFGAAPAALGVGTSAALEFRRYAWPDFEGEVDVDPTPGLESWVPASVSSLAPGSVGAPDMRVSAVMANAGAYRLRVRPVVDGCEAAAWVTSEEFVVGGGVRYVSALVGSDANDGKSRATAYATIEKAIADANGVDTMDIYVAEGTYSPLMAAAPGLLLTKSHLRLLGGYSADFTERDGALLGPGPALDLLPRSHETVVTGRIDSQPYDNNSQYLCLAAAVVGGSARDFLLDTLTLRAEPSASHKCGLFVSRGARDVVVRNSQLAGSTHTSSGGSRSRGLLTRGGSGQRYERSLFQAASNVADGYGAQVALPDAVDVVFDGNRLSGQTALFYDGMASYVAVNTPPSSSLTAVGNRFEGDTGPGAPSAVDVTAFNCTGTGGLDLRQNVLQPSLRFDGADHGNTGVGFRVELVGGTYNQACYGRVEGNLIDGGTRLRDTVGIDSASATPAGTSLVFVNNVISAGRGWRDRTGLSAMLWNQPTTDLVVAHNTFYLTTSGSSTTYTQRFLTAFWNSSSYFGRFVNNVFAGRYPTRGYTWSHAAFDGLQNNLVTTHVSNNVLLYGFANSLYAVADAEQAFCAGTTSGSTQRFVRATSNAGTALDPDALFVSPPQDADDTLDELLARDFHIQPGAEALFAMGLDTRADLCGGGSGTATPCAGAGTRSCGAVTVDRDGKPRPTSNAAVGAYEP